MKSLIKSPFVETEQELKQQALNGPIVYPSNQ